MTKPLSEKEQVYRELDRLKRHNRALREECANLRKATSAEQAAALRLEATRYRQALSNILYRLTSGTWDDATLRQIVTEALLLRNLRARDRRRIARAQSVEAQP